MNTYLGIDVGTSATKVVACNDCGEVLASSSSPHSISQPHPGWSEQEPEMWWRAAAAALREVLGSVPAADVAAVGLSGQMHGSVFLPAGALHNGGVSEPAAYALRPALLWNDQRTAQECDDVERALGGRTETVRLVGNAALTGFTAPKLLWFRKHEPDLAKRLAALCLPKDFVALRLTGVLATDVGDASGTLLFDPARRAWQDRACQRLGVDPALLPPVHESSAVVGAVTAWAAQATGLRPGTPVVIGSGDNMTSAVGSGVAAAGMVAAALGTSGVIIAHSAAPALDLGPSTSQGTHLAGRTHAMCSATGAWCITGCMLSAAGSLAWCRDVVCPELNFEQMLDLAANAPIGSAGLFFLPHLTGERCPHPDPLARGAWIGLTSRHTRAHLIRAVVEGVCFSLSQILDIVRSLGVETSRVRVSGGGARSQLQRQILADLFQRPVATTNTEEGPALGAAILAAVGAGRWPAVPQACEAMVSESTSTLPRPDAVREYARAKEAFASFYPLLSGTFPMMATFDR